MLTEEKYAKLKEELDNCNNPLFFYDDDPDGLGAFLLLYRYKKEGHGVFVKSVPKLGAGFLMHVDKYQPDKIFILDMPAVDDDFFAGTKVPIVWVDHHPHDHPLHVKSFNPHDDGIEETNTSTTGICYNTVKQDIWIAAIGAIADWGLPSFLDDFRKEYPDLLPQVKSPPEALFDTPMKELTMIFAMVLKGDTKHAKKCIEHLAKIHDPYELLEGKSESSAYIHKKIKLIKDEYEKMIAEAMKAPAEDGIIEYIYEVDRFSFSKEFSNYLQYKNPDKVVIVGRRKNGEYKLSIRAQDISIPPILDKAVAGFNGYGGGHEHACGACMDENQFDEFMERLRGGIKEALKNRNKH